MKNAAIYAYQAYPEPYGLEKQIEQGKKYCLDHSLTLVAIYQEDAGKREQRSRLLEAAKARAFAVVVVRDLSRFSRNAIEFLTIIHELQKIGIVIQTTETV